MRLVHMSGCAIASMSGEARKDKSCSSNSCDAIYARLHDELPMKAVSLEQTPTVAGTH
jgi:hypothetical protein